MWCVLSILGLCPDFEIEAAATARDGKRGANVLIGVRCSHFPTVGGKRCGEEPGSVVDTWAKMKQTKLDEAPHISAPVGAAGG